MEEHYRMSGYITVMTDVPESPAAIKAFDSPEEIGCFSLSSECEKLGKNESTKMKKFYYSPQLGEIELDLNEGFHENFEIRTFPDDKIDNVLKWIQEEKFEPVKSEEGKQVDFVCSRGAIVKLLCTPYSRDSWRIHASKFQDAIYFSSVDTEAKDSRSEDQKENDKKKSYYGLKFEQYMTTDEDGKPNLTQRCEEQGMFCAIFKNRIDGHTLLFRAEMDAAIKDTSKYVELKTCDKDVHDYYIYKSLSWWAQSTVTGIEDIKCGIMEKKDNKMVVTVLKNYKTQELHKDQKPYGCLVHNCKRRFGESSSLIGHVIDYHLTEEELKKRMTRYPYQCIIHRCPYKFDDFRPIRKHVREDHLTEKEIEGKMDKVWSPHVCIHFLNEVLNWLKSSLKNDYKEVCQLDFQGDGKVRFSFLKRNPGNEVIRDWYVEDLENCKAMKKTPHSIPSHRDRSPNELDTLLESSTEVQRTRNQYRGRSMEHSSHFSRGRSSKRT